MSRSVLADLCERITVGHVGKMSDQYVDESGVIFLRSQDIRPFAIDVDSAKRVSHEFAKKLRKSQLRAGDVVVVRTGYPGTAAVVPPELNGANCADLVVITPKVGLHPYVLAAAFNSRYGQRLVGGRLVGAAQQHFNVSAAKSLELALPSPVVQAASGEAISNLCELIENNRRRIEILEEMARLIYREWFVHFRFPGHEDVKLVDSDLGRVPEGWTIRPLSGALELVYGKALKADSRRDGEVAVYGSSGVVGWHDEALVQGPGIVVGRKGNVGAVHWSDGDFYPIDTTYFVRTELPLSFVYHVLQDLEFIDSHAAVPGLSRDQAYSLKVVVPAYDVLREFDDAVGAMYELRRNLLGQNKTLTEARDLLLPRLVSGELDVSELDLETVG